MSPATRTRWYAYRPTERAALLMEAGVDPEGILPLIRQGAVLHSGAVAFYEQDAAGNLRELPRSREDSGYGVLTTVAADPAHRYFIGLGCDTVLPCWPTFGVRLERTG